MIVNFSSSSKSVTKSPLVESLLLYTKVTAPLVKPVEMVSFEFALRVKAPATLVLPLVPIVATTPLLIEPLPTETILLPVLLLTVVPLSSDDTVIFSLLALGQIITLPVEFALTDCCSVESEYVIIVPFINLMPVIPVGLLISELPVTETDALLPVIAKAASSTLILSGFLSSIKLSARVSVIFLSLAM